MSDSSSTLVAQVVRAKPSETITPEEFFSSWIPKSVHDDPQRRKGVEEVNACIRFLLSGEGGGAYDVLLSGGEVSGGEASEDPADLTLQLSMETWRGLNRGSITAPEALIKRQLKVQGNLRLALKLHLILGP